MNRRKFIVPTLVFAVGLSAAAVVSIAQADPAKDKAAGVPDVKLPKGMTLEDMEAFMKAATPGKQHKNLQKDLGKWTGKQTLWMSPESDPTTSECTSTVTPVMDGRFVKVEFAGEIPGMGPYTGLGYVGFDNVSQKYQSTWLDNVSTGIAFGTGELSADGKTLTINYECNCPLTKKPTAMRQVETWTSPTTKTFEMFGTDPKSGKEFKSMKIEFKKS